MEGRARLDVDGEVVDLAHFLDGRGVALHVGAVAGGSLEAEHHIVGSELLAAMEGDTLAQLEAPHRRRGGRPLGGQRRGQAELLVAADQRLVDVAGETQLQRLVQRVRVHRVRVALVGHAQRGGQRAAAGQYQSGGDE
jgi:hypothetical protein